MRERITEGDLYVLYFIVAFWVISVTAIIIEWRKDCKKYGKDELAVSLGERLRAYCLCFVIPVALGWLSRLRS